MEFKKRKTATLNFNTTHLSFIIFSIALSMMFLVQSCKEDDNFEVDNPTNPPTSQLEDDKISEFLVLKNATKTTGDLPTASDGQILTDVKDTIFLVKGYPLGNRIRFKHDPIQKISGFYIKVGLASYFFDVPKDYIEDQYVPLEENDSIAVLVLDLDLSTENVEYPFTTDVIIQPHDDSGMPIDEFEREITVEDPNDNNGVCNDIRRYSSNNLVWEWDFTIREYNGTILNTLAPGLATRINSQGAGCCSTDGQNRSVTTLEEQECFNGTTSSNYKWVQIVDLDDFVVRTWEILWFWDNGTYEVFGSVKKKTYNPFNTNFCTLSVAYDYEETGYFNSGDSHDFSPGANHINLDRTNWQGGYRLPASADLIYTCHTLILSWESEDNWTSVYRKLDRNPTGFDDLFDLWWEDLFD